MSIDDTRRKLDENMLLFGKIITPNMFALPTPQFHKDLAAAYHDTAQAKTNIIAPRGHAKSSIIGGIAPLHHIFCQREINGLRLDKHVVVLISKTRDHAIRLLDTIKMILNYSEPLHQLYGYHGSLNAQRWTNNEIILDTGDVITTRGTGQQVVGMKFGNQRPTLIVLDDPEDTENTKTIESMQQNLKWLLTQLVPTRDAQRGRVFVIGTPQHEASMVMTLKKMIGWKTLHFQALADEVMEDSELQERIVRNEVDVKPEWALWPEQWSVKKLIEEKRSLESIGKLSYFYREYQCAITGDEEQLFRPEDILLYRGRLIPSVAGLPSLLIDAVESSPGVWERIDEMRPVNIFTGVDPASSLNLRADESVVLNLAVDPMANRFVLPYFSGRVDPITLGTKIIDNYLAYRPLITRIEGNGYQDMLRLYLREECQKRGITIPGLEISEKASQRKKGEGSRLDSLQPFFRRHTVFILEEHKKLRDQLLIYPRGRHDDHLDGLYYAMKGNFAPAHEASEKPDEVVDAGMDDDSDNFMLW